MVLNGLGVVFCVSRHGVYSTFVCLLVCYCRLIFILGLSLLGTLSSFDFHFRIKGFFRFVTFDHRSQPKLFYGEDP